MMAHLLKSLEAGKNIGHYGRLVFTMVARHFCSEEEVVRCLMLDPDCEETKARALYRQVQEHDYSPPARERILDWQSHQDFPIVPNPGDPDAANATARKGIAPIARKRRHSGPNDSRTYAARSSPAAV